MLLEDDKPKNAGCYEYAAPAWLDALNFSICLVYGVIERRYLLVTRQIVAFGRRTEEACLAKQATSTRAPNHRSAVIDGLVQLQVL